jgi:hypothetical protein
MLEYKPLNAARECGVTFFFNSILVNLSNNQTILPG